MAAYSKDADEWFNLERESRIFMTSSFTARRLMNAMAQDDQAREMERKRPRGKGKR